MQNAPDESVASRSEGVESEGASTDPRRLNRRRLLRQSMFAVAGLATASAVEHVVPPPARAQELASPFKLERFERETATPIVEKLHVYRIFYTFLYPLVGGDFKSVAQALLGARDLFAIYRANGCYPDGYRLVPTTLQPAPFTALKEYQALDKDLKLSFPAPPGGPSLGPEPEPGELLPIAIWRLVEPLDAQTVRVYDWCSLYALAGEVIFIAGAITKFCMDNFLLLSAPATPVDFAPVLVGDWRRINTAPPPFQGTEYHVTHHTRQDAFSTVTWNVALNLPNGTTRCRVDAYIPGSSSPNSRTAQARYSISYTGGWGMVSRSHRLSVSDQIRDPNLAWVNLGEFEFHSSNFQVILTDETGESDDPPLEVVANAIRWCAP